MSGFSIKNPRQAALALCVSLYALLWLGGVTNHFLFGGVDPRLTWLGSLFLFLAGAILFLTTRSLNEIGMLAGFAFFGFAAELCGVYTGFPFGSYVYTETLGWRLFGVPLVMTFAWMTLILYAREVLLPFDFSRLTESLLAAVFVTLIDLVIDPLAVNRLDYWRWEHTGAYYNIPWTNFAGWFLTGFLAFYLFQQKTETNPWRLRLGFSIVLFFSALALIYGFYPAALIGGLLCLPYFFGRKTRPVD